MPKRTKRLLFKPHHTFRWIQFYRRCRFSPSQSLACFLLFIYLSIFLRPDKLSFRLCFYLCHVISRYIMGAKISKRIQSSRIPSSVKTAQHLLTLYMIFDTILYCTDTLSRKTGTRNCSLMSFWLPNPDSRDTLPRSVRSSTLFPWRDVTISGSRLPWCLVEIAKRAPCPCGWTVSTIVSQYQFGGVP
jgi:hypothetical protein